MKAVVWIWALVLVACDGNGSGDAAADSGERQDAAVDSGEHQAAATDSGAALDACEDAECKVEPVCNGSAEIRIGYNLAGGGPAPNSSTFMESYGYHFLVIDGLCHYYASAEPRVGVVEGQLSDDEAAQISKDLQLSKLSRWSGSYGRGCPDAPTGTLRTSAATISASCGIEGAPAQAAEVITRVEKWFVDLTQRGAELTTPLRALAKVELGVNNSPSIPKYDWPLAQPIDKIEGLVFVPSYDDPPAGVRFADAKTLRALRAKANADHSPLSPIIRNGNSPDGYQLFLRDELPQAQADAIGAFLHPWKK